MSRLFIGLIVIVIGALAGWFAFKGGSQVPGFTLPKITKGTTTTPVPTNEPSGLYNYTETSGTPAPTGTAAGGTTTKGGVPQATGSPVRTSVMVKYTDQGFVPSVLTVKVNTPVTFTNESTGNMWVASAPHPTHDLLPGFDQKASVARGGVYTYTFVKVGTWKYHNHVVPDQTGVVVVTQ